VRPLQPGEVPDHDWGMELFHVPGRNLHQCLWSGRVYTVLGGVVQGIDRGAGVRPLRARLEPGQHGADYLLRLFARQLLQRLRLVRLHAVRGRVVRKRLLVDGVWAVRARLVPAHVGVDGLPALPGGKLRERGRQAELHGLRGGLVRDRPRLECVRPLQPRLVSAHDGIHVVLTLLAGDVCEQLGQVGVCAVLGGGV
jgi:hypothetical protein